MFLIYFLQNHLYFLGALLFSIPFIILFLYKKECRKGMIYVGLMSGLAAFGFSNISVSDYWHPAFIFKWFPFEDFLYGFFFGGFVSEASDIFLKYKFHKNKNRKRYLIIFTILAPCIIFVGINLLKINSIFILLFLTTIIAIASFIFNHKIIRLQVLSGILGVALTFIVFKILIYISPNFIIENWKIENITGLLYFGIPIEEYLFAFMFAFCITHFYEVIAGKDVKF